MARAVSLGTGFWLLLLLGALSSLPPLSIDISLPALPTIAAVLGAPVGLIAWTLSAFVAAFGAGQLVLGPLSDRWGRRPVLIGGLAIYAAAGLSCAVTTDATVLIALRCLQGFGACAGTVCARAIANDVSSDRTSGTQRQAVVTAVNTVAPIIAPLLGAAILATLGWRPLYGILAVVGLVLLLLVAVLLPETSPRRGPAVLEAYARVLRLPRTAGLTLLAFGGFFGYFALISGSSFVLITQMHVANGLFAVAFALNAAALLVGAALAGRLAARLSPERTLALGVGVVVLGGALTYGLDTWVRTPVAFVAAMALYAFGYGITIPGMFAAMLADARNDAGLASGILGAAQMLGGALGSALIAVIVGAPSTRVAIIAIVGASMCALGYGWSRAVASAETAGVQARTSTPGR